MPSRAPQAPVLLSNQPTADEMALAIANQSNRVNQLQAQIRISVQDMPGLSGQMKFERARRLRIQAKMLGIGGPGIDVGSNDEAFWIWLQTNLPGTGPSFVHARHDDFARTLAQQRVPLQPEWIADALGLVSIPSEAVLEGPFARPDRSWELRYRYDSLAGPLTRVLIVEPGTARVTQQFWYDGNSRLMAQSRASDFEYLDPPGVSMPRRIQLTIAPQTPEQMTLTLQLSGINVNLPPGSDALWEMPRPEGIPTVDLGQPGGWMTGVPTQLTPNNTPTYPEAGYRPQYRGATYR